MMNMVKGLEITIEPRLTVDDDTAHVCLRLLELYCRDRELVVEASFEEVKDSIEQELHLDFAYQRKENFQFVTGEAHLPKSGGVKKTRTRTCCTCGKEFEGYYNSRYCPECKEKKKSSPKKRGCTEG